MMPLPVASRTVPVYLLAAGVGHLNTWCGHWLRLCVAALMWRSSTQLLSAMKIFPHRDTQAMANIDYENEMTIVGVTGDIGLEKTIAVGRYILEQESNFAEVDFAVRSELQHQGIGSFLVRHLTEIARSKGVNGFMAYVLAANKKMLHVFSKTGYAVHRNLEDGIYEIRFRFDEPAENDRAEETEE